MKRNEVEYDLGDFMLREYRTGQGRWTSPDPAGLAAVDPTNPQTWNRYAYVLNNPEAMVDLLGDDGCYGPNGQDLGVAQVNCYSAGGFYLSDNSTVVDGIVYTTYNEYFTGGTLSITTSVSGTYTSLFGPLFQNQALMRWAYSVENNDTCPSGQSCSGNGQGSPSNNDPCNYLCQAVFHSPQAQNTWKQADCVANRPLKTAAEDVAWATGGAAAVGVAANKSGGAGAMLKGAVKEIGADVAAVAAGGAIYFHSALYTAYGFFAGCSE